MEEYYDAIYLSPHLDDAALSCGGRIFERTASGKSVLIVTLMAGDPAAAHASEFAQSLHRRWQLNSDVVRARRAEDRAACAVLNADWQHWDFFDCIYRVDPETKRPLYSSEEDIFGEIKTAESDFVQTLAAEIAQLPAANRIFAPLTLGGHVDHQLARTAAERCFPAAALRYYEDYPYARQYSAETFVSQQPGVWQPEIIPLTESGVAARIRAVACYESQLSTFFADEADLARQIRAFIDSIGGERIWKAIQD